jgi:hypothetical protein
VPGLAPHATQAFFSIRINQRYTRKERKPWQWSENRIGVPKPTNKRVQRHNQSPHMSQARSGETEREQSGYQPECRGTQSLPACTMSLHVLLLIFALDYPS